MSTTATTWETAEGSTPAPANPADATRAENAYMHLSSFAQGDRVTVDGPGGRFDAAVTIPANDPAHSERIEFAHLTVADRGGRGVPVKISVFYLLTGRYAIRAA